MAEFYEGDSQAWDALQRRYETKLLALVRMKRSAMREAGKRENDREIVNRTLIKAISTRDRQSGQFDPQRGSFSSWIFGICYREIVNWSRNKWDATDEPEPEPNPAEPPEPVVPLEILRECIDCLDEELSELVRLKFQHGLNQKQIAQRKGMTEPTVSRRMNDAFSKLSGCLRNKGVDFFPTKI